MDKEMNNCEHCGSKKKCHMWKVILVIIFFMIAFCLGSFFGNMRGERGGYFRSNNNGMMNWGYNKTQTNNTPPAEVVGEVTVEVKQ